MDAMYLFVIATLFPAPLLFLAALQGGGWVAAALLSVTVLVALLDLLVRRATPPRQETEFPMADNLSVVLALLHILLLGCCVWAMAQDHLGLTGKIGLWFAAGLYFGQVSNSNAHELIHRSSRFLHRIGMWVYISLLFGHHTSAHVLVHHRHVATPDDPNSARLGESYYHFAYRAWIGSFRAGYMAERDRLNRVGRNAWRNPYVIYLAGAALMLLLAFALGGWASLLGYLAIAGHAQSQLLLSDYVQHYGLSRRVNQTGKAEPVGTRHSWNAPHWYSSAMMLNAPRHSDHHAHPTHPYPALILPPDAPMLPRNLPIMASLALVPGLWRRVMDKRAQSWSA